MKFLKSKKGMTLVEVIMGLAIFCLIVLFIMAIVTASLSNIKNNSDIKKDIKNAAEDIEYNLSNPVGDGEIASEEAEFYVDFGNTIVSVKGNYINSENDEREVNFRYFVPD